MRLEQLNCFISIRLCRKVDLARDTISVAHVLANILTGMPHPYQGEEGGAWEGVDECVCSAR